MRLKKIIENLDYKSKNFKNYNIKTITHISNDVTKSSIFVCIKGNNFDGNKYAMEALSRGAKCIITEDDNLTLDNATILLVKDIRKAMSIIAYNFYNRCADNLKIIGIIGTSGKTTTSLIISQILSNYDKNIGIIGTNGVFIGNIRQDNRFTTPDPLELHYIFYQMKMLGVKTVIMEVSAQAIYYEKVYGIKFDKCVFTNISREHLDFFGSMENYARVKMDFFDKNNMRECIVNIDDFYGMELAYKVNIPCISYGINEPANSFAI
ncbi:MAG: Mur ligase family protein, partial [Christensenellales bacterium]